MKNLFRSLSDVFDVLFIFVLLFWFAETAYFGFNLHAVTDAEKICDAWVSAVIPPIVILSLLFDNLYMRCRVKELENR